MNIEKYQQANISDKYQYPEQLRKDFRNLLNIMEHSVLGTPAAVGTYNLLCGIEALLNRYETVSKETLLADNIIENYEKCAEYLINLHKEAMHKEIFNHKMIVL